MCFSDHERRSLVAVKVSISRARAHGECSVRDRHKRTVGFIESAMPADGIPRCHSPRTETSARPVSKSSSKEDYRIPRPSKRPSYWPGCRTNNPVKTNGSDVRVGSNSEVRMLNREFGITPKNGHHWSDV